MYRVISEKHISESAWWDYTDRNALATVFHTPYMHKVLSEVPKFKPFVFFAIDGKGDIVGMMNGYEQRLIPLVPSFVSSRCVMMQAPIFDDELVLGALLEHYIKNVSKKVLYTEIRSHYDMRPYSKVLEDNGFVFEDHLNIIVELNQSETDLWSQVHSKRRNEIRKAKKNGLQVREIERQELYLAYNILREVYARAKLPLMDYEFFDRCLKLGSLKCRLAVYGAFDGNIIVGTMFVLLYKNVAYDYFAGSHSAYYHMNPNDLIPWEVFLDCKNKGYEVFDFGGAGKPNVAYGVRDYKKKFGGNLVNYGRYKQSSFRMLYNLFEKMVEIRTSTKDKK